MASENNRKKPAAENVEPQPSSTGSGRKNKNQKTSKPATRSARRKAMNFFEPIRDGLMLRRIGFDADGRPIPGIHHLYNSLLERFGYDDVLSVLLAEMSVVDYSRMAEGLKRERSLDYYSSYLPTFIRYVNSSRRNLENSLKMLREIKAERAEEDVIDETPMSEDGQWVMSEDDSPCPPLSQDELFRVDDSLMEDWPSDSSAECAVKPTAPPANVSSSPTEETPAATDLAWAQEDDHISEEQPCVPAATQPTDPALAEGTVPQALQPADSSSTGASDQPAVGGAEGGLTGTKAA